MPSRRSDNADGGRHRKKSSGPGEARKPVLCPNCKTKQPFTYTCTACGFNIKAFALRVKGEKPSSKKHSGAHSSTREVQTNRPKPGEQGLEDILTRDIMKLFEPEGSGVQESGPVFSLESIETDIMALFERPETEVAPEPVIQKTAEPVTSKSYPPGTHDIPDTPPVRIEKSLPDPTPEPSGAHVIKAAGKPEPAHAFKTSDTGAPAIIPGKPKRRPRHPSSYSPYKAKPERKKISIPFGAMAAFVRRTSSYLVNDVAAPQTKKIYAAVIAMSLSVRRSLLSLFSDVVVPQLSRLTGNVKGLFLRIKERLVFASPPPLYPIRQSPGPDTPLSFAALVGGAWKQYSNRAGVLTVLWIFSLAVGLTPVGLAYATGLLASAALPALGGHTTAFLLGFGSCAGVIGFSWGIGALVAAVVDREAKILVALYRGRRFLWASVSLNIFILSLIAGGGVFLVVPGLMALAGVSGAFYIMFIEREDWITSAIKSFEYAQGQIGNTLVKLLPFIGITLAVLFHAIVSPRTGLPILAVLLLLGPFAAVFLYRVFENLRGIRGRIVIFRISRRVKARWIATAAAGAAAPAAAGVIVYLFRENFAFNFITGLI